MKLLLTPILVLATLFAVAWFGTRKARRQRREFVAREASTAYRWSAWQGQAGNN